MKIQKKISLFLLFSFCLILNANAIVFPPQQTDTLMQSSDISNKKSGFSFGLLPVVGYDADLGFKYGGLMNIYHYGDGSNYPQYNHSLYLEWSRTTRGNGINRITYDTRSLIPKVRMTLDVALLTELNLDFYGFNGYPSHYNNDYEIPTHQDYISKMYYRHSRSVFQSIVDFQGLNKGTHLQWLAGLAYLDNRIATVDVANINKKLSSEDQLPQTDLLYDKLLQWNVIGADEAKGGRIFYAKGGAVYDNRDNEANPNRGIYAEASLLTAFGVGRSKVGYSKLLLTHRQYFTLFPKRLTLAYRVSYQTKLTGKIPFYMLPYYIDSQRITDGFGGAKTIRGVLRNRVVGDGIAFGNIELRSRFFESVIFNQNFYLGLNAFADAGMVITPYHYDTSGVPASELALFSHSKERPHIGIGGGLRFVVNDNFIVAVDYGVPLNPQDGNGGMYINLGYLF